MSGKGGTNFWKVSSAIVMGGAAILSLGAVECTRIGQEDADIWNEANHGGCYSILETCRDDFRKATLGVKLLDEVDNFCMDHMVRGPDGSDHALRPEGFLEMGLGAIRSPIHQKYRSCIEKALVCAKTK